MEEGWRYQTAGVPPLFDSEIQNQKKNVGKILP